MNSIMPNQKNIQTKNLKIPSFWHFGKNVIGLKESVTSYIKRLPLSLPASPEIFESGCGNGTISLSFLERWPDAHFVATETDGWMLLAAARAAQKKGISTDKLELGEADMNNPQIITFLDREESIRLRPESFDLIITSTTLERTDLEASLPVLLRLLKPGGYFMNFGVRGNIVGKILSFFYHFSIVPETTLSDALKVNRCIDIREFSFAFDEFPASVLFKGTLAQKMN